MSATELLTIIASAVAAIAAAVAGSLATAEAKGWLPHLRHGLLRRTCDRLPEQHRERYREEWAGVLAEYDDRPLTGLKHALSLYLKAGQVAAELAPAPRAVRPNGKTVDVAQRAATRLTATGSVLARMLRRFWTLVRGRSPHTVIVEAKTVARDMALAVHQMIATFVDLGRSLATLRGGVAQMVQLIGGVGQTLFVTLGELARLVLGARLVAPASLAVLAAAVVTALAYFLSA